MKLLLIMPKFFDYPQCITEELNKLGYEVDCFDDRPGASAIIKAAVRLNRNIIGLYIKKYFKEIMSIVSEKKYDVVFLISGQSLSLSEEMIKTIKECQKEAYFVLYQWDSQKNFPYIIHMQQYFDKVFTFDRNDALQNKLTFLPLFYTRRYEKIGEQKGNNKYDFSFVGTAHPQKYKFIKKISSELIERYPKQFIYFFYPSRMVYFYRKLFNKEIRKAKYKEFHFKPLKDGELDDVIANSNCILDSPQANQQGLTIRIFEAIGAKKKIITTNKDIVNYNFYRERNIYIYDGKIDLNSEFFSNPYEEYDSNLYYEYSLRSWLTKILNR